MKKLNFTLFLILICSFGFAQKQEIFRIDSLPAQGILLDKGWRWDPGDNPDFAKPDFDDSAWEGIDPTKSIQNIIPSAKAGISWLRLKLSLSNDLQEKQFAFLIKQYIASEIYLNGRLIYRFGKMSDNPDEVLAYNPESLPVSVPLNFVGSQVLAVRYAFQSNIKFGIDQSTHNPLLELKIISSNDAFKQVSIKERHLPVTNTFRIGAYIILALLYLAFFFYNPSYKAYLFFFLFAIFKIPSDILQFNLPPEVENLVYSFRFTNIFWQIAHVFLLTAMYLLQNQKRGWIYWSLVILSFVGIVLNNWAFSELLVINLINLEVVRTCFKSLKLKTRGSWIISTGAVCFLFLMGAFYAGVVFNLSFTNIKLGESYNVLDVLYGAGQLCIPIAITIYVALDFGFTNRTLEQKIKENEVLSNEKQQILETQNETLERQVAERTAELKASQTQLIQSEKMASLGELTAGIAHEIQNPLNFVNNFSELSVDLANELKEEAEKTEIDKMLIIELATDLSQNQAKINHHGKRASDIVKGMLEHSRKSTGQKEAIDINALCDEYLKLAYHGYRAKDKNFNAIYETNLDPDLPKISVIPQDIGRALLNIINNAFYTVNERSKKGEAGYQPSVTITTKLLTNSQLQISINDNGGGIPEQIKDKIFQPFFTTKPTGQGTGLGLSLSYDIVKAHGGELKVESKEGEGTTFLIQIPITSLV